MTYFKRLVVPVLVLAMILIFSGCGAEIEYDPHAYIDVGFQGLNGYATVFMDKHGRLNSKLSQEQQENIEYMLNVTTFEITPNENLKNGDVVKIKPVFDEKLCKDKKLKPIIREREVVVADLKEPVKVVTLFEELSIEYVDVSNSDGGMIFVKNSSNDENTKNIIKYSTKTVRGYKNKDEFVVTATCDYEKAEQLGYAIVGDTTKTYIADGFK